MSSFEQSEPMARVIATARDFFDTLEYYMDIATRLQRLLNQESLCQSGCSFMGNSSVFDAYIAPLPNNPYRQTKSWGNGHEFCIGATWSASDGTKWYRIEAVRNKFAELGEETEDDPALPGWVRAIDLPVTLECDLPRATQFDENSSVPWDGYAGQDRITFRQWPIAPQLICGQAYSTTDALANSVSSGIHGIGFPPPRDEIKYLGLRAEDLVVDRVGIHHGIDLFAPNEYSDIPVSSVDYGIVVGIGIFEEQGVHSQRFYGATEGGYSVIVRYGHLYVTYGHLSQINDIWVGKVVYPGEVLGTLGLNGERHLHFEVRSFGSDSLTVYEQKLGQEIIDQESGTLAVDLQARYGSAPYIYDPIQFLPSPLEVNQPISGVLKPEETLEIEANLRNSEFYNSLSTEYIRENGTHVGGNVWSVDVRVSKDCVVRFSINLDPQIVDLDGYRGFQGYYSDVGVDDGKQGITSPLNIPSDVDD